DGIRDYKVTGVQTCALPIWPFAEAQPAHLALAHHMAQRLHGFLQRRLVVVAVALVEVDVVGLQPGEGTVDLLEHLGPREAPVAEIGRASCRERGEVTGGDGG